MYVFRECFIIKLLIVILMNMPAVHAHQGKILAQAPIHMDIVIQYICSTLIKSIAVSAAAFLINVIMK